MGNWVQSKYTPVNREKYIGSKDPVCRSSWERKACIYLDTNENILEWGSECLIIQYYNPIDGKNHKYYPDFYCRVKKRDGTFAEYIIEIKPIAQSVAPKIPKKKTAKALENYRAAQQVVMKNKFKWEAAETYCNKHGYEFKVITENELFS
jgi:hypothetical protein